MSDSPRSKFIPSRFKVRKRTGPGPKRPFHVSSVIEKTPDLSAIGAKITEYRLVKAWPGVVGERIAARAVPARLIGGVLYCTVASGPWMTELNFQKGVIIEGLNRALGAKVVTSMVLKLGTVEPPAAKTPEKKEPPRQLTAEDRQFIDDAVGVVQDPELKAVIKRALVKALT